MKNKILSWGALKRRVSQAKRKGQKIVFTNGCFDLIHAGHLKVFESSKKMGDLLVVGLNSDSSVRKLKGPGRPILKQKDRSRLLAGFEVVDFVTFFSQDTPAQLIQKIKPDVLVKGGDYKPSQMVGREFVKKTVRVPLVKGISTTGIIKKILKGYAGSSKK